MVLIGLAEGICDVCGRTLRRPRPEKEAVCDCYRFCPLCSPAYTVPMTPFTPDLTPSTYKLPDTDQEWSLNTFYYCDKHSPPYYSDQKPVEVQLA